MRRQTAPDAGLVTDGKAYRKRWRPAARTAATRAAPAAVARPLPWKSGRTVQPVSYTVSPRQARSQ